MSDTTQETQPPRDKIFEKKGAKGVLDAVVDDRKVAVHRVKESVHAPDTRGSFLLLLSTSCSPGPLFALASALAFVSTNSFLPLPPACAPLPPPT
jgi:hypothetical protein